MLCYMFLVDFLQDFKGVGHRTANLLRRVAASFQKRFQVQKLFSRVISN